MKNAYEKGRRRYVFARACWLQDAEAIRRRRTDRQRRTDRRRSRTIRQVQGMRRRRLQQEQER